MKKILYLLIILLTPLYTFAYSNYIIPGGDTLGLEVKSNGIIIVGFYEVNGQNLNNHLKVGDRITKVNGQTLEDTEDLITLIDKYMVDKKVKITYIRDNKEYEDYIYLDYYNNTYRTGIYIKYQVLGIGTLTYIDPSTNIYGILGHSLSTSDTQTKIEIKEGTTYEAKITSFTRSIDGTPGSKNADINKNSEFGNLLSNTNYGVFGKTTTSLNRKALPVATLDEVSLGKAYIYTTNLDNEIEKYTIKILEINKTNEEKNLYFEITDQELLKMTGGIVQGMSGSPIIQDNKIIGAVTRVLVDDVTKGYGISIITMLEEGDKLSK